MQSLGSDLDYVCFMSVIDEMHKCVSEGDRTSPKVAALVTRGDIVLGVAYRGEVQPGEHAEFTLLERKLVDENLHGSTLYTTLEPCTDRTEPKIPCADRIIERGIKNVWIGMLDPNPDITGKGLYRLRAAGLNIQLFPGEYMSRIEEGNIEFSRSHRLDPKDRESFIEELESRSLDAWYLGVNQIYADRNLHMPLSYVFSHLVEVIGGLSGLASEKVKGSVDPGDYVRKALAWWLALCGSAGVRSAADVVWRKFPGVCSYCEQTPHADDDCRAAKQLNGGPRWDQLAMLATSNLQPRRLSEWLKMFREIYPVQQNEAYGPSFARLSEELGELAEAVRLFEDEPGYFLSEAADVFAWLMHIENIRQTKLNVLKSEIGSDLDSGFAAAYPDFCIDCEAKPCRCPRILKRTVGRIAKEMPRSPLTAETFMPAQERRAMFRI